MKREEVLEAAAAINLLTALDSGIAKVRSQSGHKTLQGGRYKMGPYHAEIVLDKTANDVVEMALREHALGILDLLEVDMGADQEPADEEESK